MFSGIKLASPKKEGYSNLMKTQEFVFDLFWLVFCFFLSGFYNLNRDSNTITKFNPSEY